jgi:AraC-like DNA-binding protein
MLVHLAQHTAIGIAFDRIFVLISVQRDVAAPIPSTESPRESRRCTPLQKWRMKRVTDHVDAHLSRRISLADMAAAAGLTRMHFAAQFRAAIGMRPHDFVLQRRIERAQDLLRNPERPLVDVALNVGFQNQAHFTTVFKRFAGETPHRWRRLASGYHAPKYAGTPDPSMERGGAEMYQDGQELNKGKEGVGPLQQHEQRWSDADRRGEVSVGNQEDRTYSRRDSIVELNSGSANISG